MSKVAVNTAANFVGSFWGGVISLIFIPIYIRYLGVEAYGLIGISSAIISVLIAIDFGIGPTLLREMSRQGTDDKDIHTGRRALSTLTRIYLPLAVFWGGLIVLAAPYISSHWIRTSALPPEIVENSLRLIGIMTAFQLVNTFYSTGLIGLQRQVYVNVIFGTGAVIQAVGSLLLLEFYGPNIVAFFVWQTVFVGIQAAVVALSIFSFLPDRSTSPKFDRALMRDSSGFMLGTAGIGLLSIILTHTDKLVMSKLLNLYDYGLYSLGIAIAMSLRRLFGPLFSAVYPRFTELARKNDISSMERLYHVASEAMSVIILPVSLMLIFYSHEVVYLWTGDQGIANHIHLLLALLVAGTAFNGLANMPYALQLAHGWTRLALVTNFIAALFIVPGTYLLGKYYGGEGAAAAWVILNFGYLVIQAPLMHKRLLPGHLMRWYVHDTLLPFLAALVPIISALPLIRTIEEDRFVLLPVLVTVGLLSATMALLAARTLRNEIWQKIVSRTNRV